MIRKVNDRQEFHRAVFDEPQSEVTLVDFYADWCGPCQVIAPTLDELTHKSNGKVNVVKVNVDDHPELASEFQVRGIPSLFFFKDGELKQSISGAHPLSSLENIVQSIS